MCMSRKLVEALWVRGQCVIVVQWQLLLKQRSWIDTLVIGHEPLQVIRCTARMAPRDRVMCRLPWYTRDCARETRAGCPTLHCARRQVF